MPLHIFEKRYQQLFDEMESIGISVALPYRDDKSGSQFASICELVRITKRYKSGERDVIVECKSLHWLESQESVFPGKLYPGGTIGDEVDLKDIPGAPTYLLEQFADYIELKYGKRPKLADIRRYTLMDVAACINMSNDDKIRFIALDSDEKREKQLGAYIEYLKFLFFQEAQAENGIILN